MFAPFLKYFCPTMVCFLVTALIAMLCVLEFRNRHSYAESWTFEISQMQYLRSQRCIPHICLKKRLHAKFRFSKDL